jgi:hypothetical protein
LGLWLPLSSARVGVVGPERATDIGLLALVDVTEECSELARSGSNFIYGEDALDLTEILPRSTGQRAHYVSANIFWLPVERMGVDLEYPEGHRKNEDGQRS